MVFRLLSWSNQEMLSRFAEIGHVMEPGNFWVSEQRGHNQVMTAVVPPREMKMFRLQRRLVRLLS